MKRKFSEEHKRNIRKSFTQKRREQISKHMKENNPMNNETNRGKQKRNCRKAHRKLAYRRAACIQGKQQWTNKYRKMMKAKMIASWTPERKAQLSNRMRKGGKQQCIMQRKGNKRRKGLPNTAIVLWRKNNPKGAQIRDDNASLSMVNNFKGTWGTYYKKGNCKTKRFGKLRFDSGWERKFILRIRHIKEIKSIVRDFPIVYKIDGKRHRFLVDFILKTKKEIIMVELKGKRFKDSKSTKAKIKYAKRFCKKNNWKFILITSSKAIKEFSI